MGDAFWHVEQGGDDVGVAELFGFGGVAVFEEGSGVVEEGGLALAPFAVDADGEGASGSEGGAGDDVGVLVEAEEVVLVVADGFVGDEVEWVDAGGGGRRVVAVGHDAVLYREGR